MKDVDMKKNRLVVAKAGQSPWWPSEVIVNVESEAEVGKVHVDFLGVGQRSWVGEGDLARVRSRDQLELFLEEKRSIDVDNMKYSNNIPETMRESYNNAWNMYRELWKSDLAGGYISHDVNMVDVSSKETKLGFIKVPCEICMNMYIEKDCGPLNTNLLNISEQDRDMELSRIMISAGKDITQCDNRCIWKYHSSCVTSEKDLVCSCNKSSWQCSVCYETVSASEIFICDNHECMRAYHKTCIKAHLSLQPDVKQCPLHQCINCRLDGLSNSEDSALAYCVKCKIAFHNNRQCLPSVYITVSDKYIVCGLHLLDFDTLKSRCVDLCFCCLRPTSNIPSISCLYCPISYHNTDPCLPSWLDLCKDDEHFICHGCKFPFVRRSCYMFLSPPSGSTVMDIAGWRVGLSERSLDFKTLILHNSHTTITYRVSLYNAISINLQSLDHLVAFGLSRYADMQEAIRHLSKLVNSVSSSHTHITNTYRNNGFILLYSSLFPTVDNMYDIPQVSESDVERMAKCACIDFCSTSNCCNVAANIECTKWNCNSLSRCRNRRMQKRLFPRQKLIIGDDKERPYVVLEEAVVKDVLVMELVGRVRKSLLADALELREHLFVLSDTFVIDNSRYCNLSRFVEHSEWPNLVSKSWNVAGSQRLGLFSCRRIAANETLTLDMKTVRLERNVSSLENVSMNLVPWSEVAAQETVDDSCPEFISNSGVIDLSVENIDSVYCEGNTSLSQRPPLCPVCLNELRSDYSISRSMIHCVNCYTVHHLKCAYSSLTVTKSLCRVEKDPRLMRFVCEHCRAITDD